VRVEDAGGGGGRSEIGLLGPEVINTSSSGTVSSVGSPLYGKAGGEWAEWPERTDAGRELVLFFLFLIASAGESSASTLPSLHVLPPPLPSSFDCGIDSDRPFERVRGGSKESVISTGTFSLDSPCRVVEGVRTVPRGDGGVREEGGGDIEAERDALESRGETEVKCDKGFEGDTGSVWAIWPD
jgi:hypothetical protein